jgi:hypothetical protein
MTTAQRLIVSVVIPTYNCGQYLNQALDSVLSQGNPCFQLDVVVVDDGSTDNTDKVSQSYGKDIKYSRIPHCGFPGIVRNHGLRKAVGELVAFLDADDFLLPHSLDRRIEVLQSQPEVGFVYGNYLLLQGENQWLHFADQDPPSGSIFNDLFEANFINADTVLARRQLIEKSGGFFPSVRTAEDYWLWLQLAKRAKGGYVRDPLAVTRLRAGSVSGISLTEKMPNLILVVGSIAQQFKVPSASVNQRLNPLRLWLAMKFWRECEYWHALRCLVPAIVGEPTKMARAFWAFARKQVCFRRCNDQGIVR